MTKRAGVIGTPLGHTVSPAMFSAAFAAVGIDATYEAWETAPDVLEGRVNSLRGADFLSVFDQPHREALAMLFLKLSDQMTLVSEIFWGLWLFPLGLLTYRSGFLPRFLGVWLLINGVAYVAMSFTGMMAPQHMAFVSKITFPLLFGEMAFMLWLVIRGARPKPAGDSSLA